MVERMQVEGLWTQPRKPIKSAERSGGKISHSVFGALPESRPMQ